MILASTQLADNESFRQKYRKFSTIACYQSLFRGITNQSGWSSVSGVDTRAEDSDLMAQVDMLYEEYDSFTKPSLMGAAREMGVIREKMRNDSATTSAVQRFGLLMQDIACVANLSLDRSLVLFLSLYRTLSQLLGDEEWMDESWYLYRPRSNASWRYDLHNIWLLYTVLHSTVEYRRRRRNVPVDWQRVRPWPDGRRTC
jgi:hypothetical protein